MGIVGTRDREREDVISGKWGRVSGTRGGDVVLTIYFNSAVGA